MILDSMRAIQADGAAFIDAHPDLEVFRLRLGKALNFDVRFRGSVFSLQRACLQLIPSSLFASLNSSMKTGKELSSLELILGTEDLRWILKELSISLRKVS